MPISHKTDIRSALRTLAWPVRPIIRKWREYRGRMRLKQSLNFTGQAAHDYLRARIESNAPFMACRFGWNELHALFKYGRLVTGYHKGQRYDPGQYSDEFHSLAFQAGFFPLTPEHIARFYHRMMADMREIDVLGSWMPEELDLKAQLNGVVRVNFHDLDPVIEQPVRPWTASLRGKRVLVVHPFDRSIQSQYAKRTLLFDNPDNLPDFDLITVRAVQNPAWTFRENAQRPSSVSGVGNEFSNWFEALAYMEQQVEAVEFDVALIGCGAYEFPLAAHVKRLGRKAMHLGGITQMLFGIKGDRWINAYGFSGYNEHWVYPLPEETPMEASKVEAKGTYWGLGH